MLLDKQTYFESHHHLKNSYRENNLISFMYFFYFSLISLVEIYLSWSSAIFPISKIFVSYSGFLIKSLVSTVWIALTFLINSWYTILLTTSFFTTLLCLPKSIGVVSICSISNLSASGFKLNKLPFLANFDVLMPAALFKSDLVA